MSLLGASTQRGLLAGRLEAVGLENTLERLRGRTMSTASVTTTTYNRSGRHFVLTQESFTDEAQ